MTDKFELPEFAPDYWTSPEGFEVAKSYLKFDRSMITHGGISDESLAHKYELSDSTQMDWTFWQTAIKERIRWLSVRVFVYKAQNQKLKSAFVDDVVVTINDPEHLHRYKLYHSEISDFDLANKQYLLSRGDDDVKGYIPAASQRVRWLSKELQMEVFKFKSYVKASEFMMDRFIL